MKCTLTKKSPGMKAAAKAKAGAAGVASFNLQDDGSGMYSVLGVDAAGNQVDISSVAKLTPEPTSDDPAIVIVHVHDPAVCQFEVHAATPPPAVGAKTVVHVTATWNDGSVGPFTFDVTYNIQAGPVSGIIVVPTSVVVH